MNQLFDANAGFHLANAGTDRNVQMVREIGTEESERIRAANLPEIIRLLSILTALKCEAQQLRLVLAIYFNAGTTRWAWPVWQILMTIIFATASFAFARISFEPFDFNPELLWPCCIALSVLCAYGTSEYLEKTNSKLIVLGFSIALFVSSIAGLAILASVRGEIFLHQLKILMDSADGSSMGTPDVGLAFYAAVGQKMRLFLVLLSLSLEFAAGLSLHEVRLALKARKVQLSSESQRLEIVNREIGQIEARLTFLRNEHKIFEHEYRRNLLMGLLAGTTRHVRSNSIWPTSLLAVAFLGLTFALQGQAVDVWEGLDLSATSLATGYDGTVAHSQNIEAAARVIMTLPPGSHITVAGISDQSFSRPLVLFTGQIPNSSGRLREYDQILATRTRLAGRLRRLGPSIKPDFQTTDILGFLISAGMAFNDTPRMRHVVVIHSDMRQSSPPLDIEHARVVQVATALATVKEHQLFADLSGVEIYIYGVHSVGKDVPYWLSLREFWRTYFERSGAHLRVFSMLRDAPDFSLPLASSQRGKH